MTTDFMQRQFDSRLHELRQVCEEISVRREDGVHVFTATEPATGRLLNALAKALAEDERIPGDLFEFLRSAVESLPNSVLTHGPLDEVLRKNKQDSQDNFRLWIIAALNQSGSLKQTLSLTLPMKDVLECFVQQQSLLLHDKYVEELLKLLSIFETHPEHGPITFRLDVTALQLFEDHPLEVMIIGKTRKHKHNGEPREKRTMKRKEAMGISEEKIGLNASCQTEDILLESQFNKGSLGTSHGANVPRLRETSTQTAGQSEIPCERWCQTENPSTLMNFAELCELSELLLAREHETRSANEEAKARLASIREKDEDVADRLEQTTKILLRLKTLYNELFLAGQANSEFGFNDVGGDMIKDNVRALLLFCQSLEGGSSFSMDSYKAARLLQQTTAPSTSSSTAASSSTAEPAPTKPQREEKKEDLRLQDEEPDAHPEGGKEITQKILLEEPTERDRTHQLSLQNNKCPNCGEMLDVSNTENLLFKAAQKAGSALRLGNKPRRCHYCCQLFCHRCHTNKVAILPFRVFKRWDFTPQHVCDSDFELLSRTLEQPIFNLQSLPPELASRPNIQTCAQVRAKLIVAARAITGCTNYAFDGVKSFFKKHYLQKEFWYSVSDFIKLKGGALQTGFQQVAKVAKVATLGLAPEAQNELIGELETILERLYTHIRTDCGRCKRRCSAVCSICLNPKAVFVVDPDAFVCKSCHSIYHAACHQSMGCKCKSK